jgi:hypothetical protein
MRDIHRARYGIDAQGSADAGLAGKSRQESDNFIVM